MKLQVHLVFSSNRKDYEPYIDLRVFVCGGYGLGFFEWRVRD